ncbi:hypothetical protein H5410_024206 [Solanum commersonii]|uniref:J domain-containing protein n=1 Tax=Solanum commersonii TaxID=4109 RepID=A0A9J5ZLA7_SOLCO|nr:hypothetical protein H5410_024206 [Solanum commersonii]
MGNEEGDEDNRGKPYQEKDEMKLWGIFVFALIGATATTFAVTQLRSTVDFVYSQLRQSAQRSRAGGSFRTSFQEEAWKRYNRRMREEYEEEMERVERIRRMQSVFNRERNKYKRSYESWQENGQSAYHQHFQRNDWYWKADTSFRDRGTNFREAPRANASNPLSHDYSVLGLDRFFYLLVVPNVFLLAVQTGFFMALARSRTKPYTDDEIKSAFREKAKQFHPDQNQQNKETAEAKFKEVMKSYEAIKSERKNGTSR